LEGLEAAAEIGFTEEDLALWDMQDDVLGAVHVINFTPGANAATALSGKKASMS
jgi:hypothetical protein